MKKINSLALLFLIFINSYAQQTAVFDKKIEINGNSMIKDDGSLFDLNNKTDLDNYIRTVILTDANLVGALNAKQNTALKTFITTPLNSSAIILLRHDLDAPGLTTRPNPQLTERADIIKTVLHQEKGQYSDYLLETKKVLLVFIGGATDLQNAVVSIKNRKNALAESFDGLSSLIPQALKGAGVSFLPCRIILVEETAIKLPTDVEIQIGNNKDAKVTIHEKAWAQFKAGVSMTHLDKKYFKLQNGQLNVSLDDEGKAEWKANLIATFDFYPFGRDLDRLDVLWKKNGIPFEQRFGLYAGLQISKDPLQGIYYGVSFAPARNITLNIGAASVLEAGAQTVNVGEITSVQDAKQLLKRTYETKFFIGLTFSPTDLSKMVFGNKDDKK